MQNCEKTSYEYAFQLRVHSAHFKARQHLVVHTLNPCQKMTMTAYCQEALQRVCVCVWCVRLHVYVFV